MLSNPEKRELVTLLLDWEWQMGLLANLEKKIANLVLKAGETQVVGNVRATYNKGRTAYDYYGAVSDAQLNYGDEEIDQLEASKEKHSKISISVAWKSVCEDMELEPLVKSQGDPSVKVKFC